MKNKVQLLTERLRDRIVSAIHMGHVRAGDRLPSIREMAAETGEDARVIARAYRALEAEGLVEVRARSGVYARVRQNAGGAMLEEAAQWAARVLVDAWKRAIPIDEVPGFFQRCTASRSVRCVFVEVSEDVLTAFTHDLREHLGLETKAVRLRDLTLHRSRWRSEDGRLPSALRNADLVLTTGFHAREVARVAAALAKPMIAVTANPNMVAAMERQLLSGGLTVVCADPRFGDRIRSQYHTLVTPDNPIRIVLAHETREIARLDPSEPVVLTRAARQRLGRVDLRPIFPHSPTMSSSSVLEIAEFVVRFNLEQRPGR